MAMSKATSSPTGSIGDDDGGGATTIHVAKRYDTLEGIAVRYDCPAIYLMQMNKLQSRSLILGQKIYIPDKRRQQEISQQLQQQKGLAKGTAAAAAPNDQLLKSKEGSASTPLLDKGFGSSTSVSDSKMSHGATSGTKNAGDKANSKQQSGSSKANAPADSSTLTSATSSTKATRLYVGRLPAGTTQADVEQLFFGFGPIRINMVYGCDYCFVDVQSRQIAEKAIQNLNATELKNRTVVVNFARPRPIEFPNLSVDGWLNLSKEQFFRRTFSQNSDDRSQFHESELNDAQRKLLNEKKRWLTEQRRSENKERNQLERLMAPPTVERVPVSDAAHCGDCDGDVYEGCGCDCVTCVASQYYDYDDDSDFDDEDVPFKERKIKKGNAPKLLWPYCNEAARRGVLTNKNVGDVIWRLYKRKVGESRHSIRVVQTSDEFEGEVNTLINCPCIADGYTTFAGVLALDGEFASDCRPYDKWPRRLQFLAERPPNANTKKGPFARWISVSHFCGRCVIFNLENDHGLGALERLINDRSIKIITWAGPCDGCAIRNSFGTKYFPSWYDIQETWKCVKGQFGTVSNKLGGAVVATTGAAEVNDRRESIIDRERAVKFRQFWNLKELPYDYKEYAAGDAISLCDLFFVLTVEFPSLLRWLGRSDFDEKISAAIRFVAGVDVSSTAQNRQLTSNADVADVVEASPSSVSESSARTLPGRKRAASMDDNEFVQERKIKRKKLNANLKERRQSRRLNWHETAYQIRTDRKEAVKTETPRPFRNHLPRNYFLKTTCRSEIERQLLLANLRCVNEKQAKEARLTEEQIGLLVEFTSLKGSQTVTSGGRHLGAIAQALIWKPGPDESVLDVLRLAVLNEIINEQFFDVMNQIRCLQLVMNLKSIMASSESSPKVKERSCQVVVNALAGGKSGRRFFIGSKIAPRLLESLTNCLSNVDADVRNAAAMALENFAVAFCQNSEDVGEEHREAKNEAFRSLLDGLLRLETNDGLKFLSEDDISRLLRTLLTFVWNDKGAAAIGCVGGLKEFLTRLQESNAGNDVLCDLARAVNNLLGLVDLPYHYFR